MLNARSVFGLTFTFFSLYTQATLASELICDAFMSKYDQKDVKIIARLIYEDAFRLSFDGEWSKAKNASACAGMLDHGTLNWAFEAKDLIN